MKKIIFIFSLLFLSDLATAVEQCDAPGNYVLGDPVRWRGEFQCSASTIANRTSQCESAGGRLVLESIGRVWDASNACYSRNEACFIKKKSCDCPDGQKMSTRLVGGEWVSECMDDNPTPSDSSSSSDCSLSESCSSSSASSLPYCSQVEAPAMCIPDPVSSSAPTSSSPPVSSASGSSGSNTSTGGNRDTNPAPTSPSELCELNFGVGNCAAVPQSTPCPNSYTANGQKFCVTTSSSNSSSGSSSGSSTGSGVGTSAPSNSATANNCSTQPTCTGDDAIQCAILRQSWLNFCDGAENKTDINADSDSQAIAEAFDDLVNDNQTSLNSDGTIAGTSGEVDISQYGDLISDLNNAASSPSSGSCPAPRQLAMSIGTFELSYQPFCDLADSISYLVLLSFSIFGSLIIYRTVERI